MKVDSVYKCVIWIFFSSVSITYTLTTNSIIAYTDSMLVHEGQNAVLKWIISGNSYTNRTVKCTAKRKNILVAIGEYNQAHRRFIFRIPQEGQFKYDFRLNGIVHVQSQNKNVFTLTIEKSTERDIDTYSCKFDQVSSEVNLRVYSELVEMGRIVKSITLTKDMKTVSTELCAYPEPLVTMEIQGVVTHVKGERKPSSNCYIYYFRNLTSIRQNHCGEELKLIYRGVKKTLRRRVSITIPLAAEPPGNVAITMPDERKCSVIRWDGPNIGSCLSNSIRYDVVVFKHKTVIQYKKTSSNLVEVCGVDFLQKEFTVKVRNTIGNTNSSWVQGTIVEDGKPYDGMQTAIIACGALVVFLLILMISYCCYVHKYRIVRACVIEKRLSVSEEEEVEPLNSTQNDGAQQQQTPNQQKQTEQKTEGKRKSSRKISLDALLGDHTNTLRKSSMNGGEQTKYNTKPNNATRFYSLQRNIERERKKVEEQEKEQQLDDMYTQRRNTDSKVFQDFTKNLNSHHFGPRYSDESHKTNSTGYEQSPGSPLYDVLPTTRSSASTNSTGPSYHEEDERGRNYRNTLDDSSFMSDSSTTPLYDVLPRKNTAPSLSRPSHMNTANNQVYDYVPTLKKKEPNGEVLKETIYDVPVKKNSLTNGDTRHLPFSSHRKQEDEEDLYQNNVA